MKRNFFDGKAAKNRQYLIIINTRPTKNTLASSQSFKQITLIYIQYQDYNAPCQIYPLIQLMILMPLKIDNHPVSAMRQTD